jgi:hypothetical protein
MIFPPFLPSSITESAQDPPSSLLSHRICGHEASGAKPQKFKRYHTVAREQKNISNQTTSHACLIYVVRIHPELPHERMPSMHRR